MGSDLASSILEFNNYEPKSNGVILTEFQKIGQVSTIMIVTMVHASNLLKPFHKSPVIFIHPHFQGLVIL
jgi:hypothetical protein